MDRVSLNQMANRIIKALDLNEVQYSRLESGFSFAFAVGAIVSGVIVDKVNVRWIYPLMVLGWSAAGVLTGYATGFAWLFVCRVALGLFEAGNWPCGIRTVRTIMRPEERSLGNSLFSSGTAAGAIITPVVVLVLVQHADAAAGTENHPDSWKLPFIVIGYIGVAWVLLWFLTVPGRILDPATSPGATSHAGAARYRDVFRDRRFWGILLMAIAINITWHTYRAWLPLYVQRKRGFSETEMTAFMTWFYLVADIGSWTIGLLTLVWIRRGRRPHAARFLALSACAALAVLSLAVPFVRTGWMFTGVVLIFVFGALGLFPTYFALSQELSAAHQGKVSGTLGACSHLFLALIVYPIQGYVIKEKGLYNEVLAVAGIFPLIALGFMLWLWPPGYEPPVETTSNTRNPA
jgi:ACS family hexuronate transporter-like MFS transporter